MASVKDRLTKERAAKQRTRKPAAKKPAPATKSARARKAKKRDPLVIGYTFKKATKNGARYDAIDEVPGGTHAMYFPREWLGVEEGVTDKAAFPEQVKVTSEVVV